MVHKARDICTPGRMGAYAREVRARMQVRASMVKQAGAAPYLEVDAIHEAGGQGDGLGVTLVEPAQAVPV